MGQKVLDSFLNKEASVETVVEGFVDYTDSFVLGYFSPSVKNVIVENEEGVLVTVMDKSIIPKHYVLVGDVYTSIEKVSIVNMPNIINVVPNKTQFEYSASKENIQVRSEYISKLGFESYSEAALLLHKHLGDLSVGIEFETISGLIPHDELLESGLIPLRDGSIAGIEYATIPLKGKDGAQTLVNCISTINTHVKSDDTCALHYHFGGVPRTEEFIVAFWRVMVQFQNDLYLMNSPYKCLNWGIKKKNYSKPLPVLQGLSHKKTTSENAAIIINYLLGGVAQYSDYDNNLKNIKNHPQDPENRQKWNITHRYSIVNLIPLIFGNKQTVEFRMSDITSNKTHIYNEVYLLSSLVKFAISNSKTILTNDTYLNNIKILDVVEYVNTNQYKYVRNFVQLKESVVATSVRNNISVVVGLDSQSSSVCSDLYTIPLKSNPEFEVDFYRDYHSFLKIHNQVFNRNSFEEAVTNMRRTAEGRMWGTFGRETRTRNQNPTVRFNTDGSITEVIRGNRGGNQQEALILEGVILDNAAHLRSSGLLKSNLLQGRNVFEKSENSVGSLIMNIRRLLLNLGTGSTELASIVNDIEVGNITSHTFYELFAVLQLSTQDTIRAAVNLSIQTLTGLGFDKRGISYSININNQNLTISKAIHSRLVNTTERILHSEFAYLFVYQTYVELLNLTGVSTATIVTVLRSIGISTPVATYTTQINESFARGSLSTILSNKFLEIGIMPNANANLSYPEYLTMMLIKYAEAIHVRGNTIIADSVTNINNDDIFEEDDE